MLSKVIDKGEDDILSRVEVVRQVALYKFVDELFLIRIQDLIVTTLLTLRSLATLYHVRQSL